MLLGKMLFKCAYSSHTTTCNHVIKIAHWSAFPNTCGVRQPLETDSWLWWNFRWLTLLLSCERVGNYIEVGTRTSQCVENDLKRAQRRGHHETGGLGIHSYQWVMLFMFFSCFIDLCSILLLWFRMQAEGIHTRGCWRLFPPGVNLWSFHAIVDGWPLECSDHLSCHVSLVDQHGDHVEYTVWVE